MRAILRARLKKLQVASCGSAYRNCATCSLTFSDADGTALSIFSTGPNGEGIINSTLFAATTGNAAHRCQSSIHNCSAKRVENTDRCKIYTVAVSQKSYIVHPQSGISKVQGSF